METGLLIEFMRMGTATVVLHLAGLGTVQIAARNAGDFRQKSIVSGRTQSAWEEKRRVP